jgi:hypothetical protein
MSLVSHRRVVRAERLNALLLVAAMIFVLPLLRVHERFNPHDGTRLSIKLNLLGHKAPRVLESVFDHVLDVVSTPRTSVPPDDPDHVPIQPALTERLPLTIFDRSPEPPRGPPASLLLTL